MGQNEPREPNTVNEPVGADEREPNTIELANAEAEGGGDREPNTLREPNTEN
jgi:hypothetical protein